MKTTELIAKRLRKDRPMTSITMRMPEDVVKDLKRIAPLLGFSGYQALLKSYVGLGLRKDLAKLEAERLPQIVSALRKRGVSSKAIADAISEANS
ncbi:MAG: hypothetical protein ACKVQA_12760 [Burkholderiales bacterium]